MTHAAQLADQLQSGFRLSSTNLVLDLSGFLIRIRSNSDDLLTYLRRYFELVVTDNDVDADVEVVALETHSSDAEHLSPLADWNPSTDWGPFSDWHREPGKSGRKDAYRDLVDGRLVLKLRTGMMFLQSHHHRLAVGPCMENPNQVINFINSQYMNYLQQRGYIICHAAGLEERGRTIALAGLSGGGKSTLMLQALAEPGTRFLTNDRLFIKQAQGHLQVLGIPKLPRVNPGTIINNPALQGMFSKAQTAAFQSMPNEELWNLELKHDVDVAAAFGANKIADRGGALSAVVILNWDRHSKHRFEFRRADLKERPDLLGAIMKSPGPFYQAADGSFLSDDRTVDARPYADLLAGVAAFEARGKIDFEQATEHCLKQLRGAEAAG